MVVWSEEWEERRGWRMAEGGEKEGGERGEGRGREGGMGMNEDG